MCSLVVPAVVAALASATAQAAFPGRSGLIAFTSDRDGRNQVYVMNADGSGQRNLSRDRGVDVGPSWSPDGRKIAYTCTLPGREDQDVCVMNADGSGRTDLTADSRASDGYPSWSPKPPLRLVFQSNRGKADANDSDVYVMNEDGSGVVPLAATRAREEEPAWAVGDRVVYVVSTSYDDHALHTMDPAGAEKSQLGPSILPVNATPPRWSPDARSIVFQGVVPGTPGEIYSMRSDGTHLRKLTAPPGTGYGADFSPDGRHVGFNSDRAGSPSTGRTTSSPPGSLRRS